MPDELDRAVMEGEVRPWLGVLVDIFRCMSCGVSALFSSPWEAKYLGDGNTLDFIVRWLKTRRYCKWKAGVGREQVRVYQIPDTWAALPRRTGTPSNEL